MLLLVQVLLGRGLGGEGGVTVKGLLSEGYEAVFIGIGLPDPKVAPMFEGLTPQQGFYTSKDFLPIVSMASKPGQRRVCRCESGGCESGGCVRVGEV